MRIIVDAFGGDNAPLEIIKGAALAVQEYGHTILLVGREAEIRKVAAESDISLEGMEIADAPDVISMDDEPKSILKEHKDCSMAEGLRRLAAGEGDAMVSAGSTGALIMGSTFLVKRIKGVSRAALAALSLPRMVSPQLVLRAHAGKGTLPPPAVWRELVAKASGRYGLDPRLIAAVIKVESNFETIAESEKGAQGLMQLMPGTQQMLGVIDPFDPEANVDAGSRYLRQQIDRFGRLDLALAAYNAGPGNVLRYGGIPPFAETQAYVSKVLSLLDADN